MKLVSSNKISNKLIDLLTGIELGTNGARYIHKDIKTRIKETDNPLSFSLERNDNLVANITFCVRDIGYYLRYFAFSKTYQGKTKRKTIHRSANSSLEKEISNVFEALIKDKPGLPLYAYIDYENDRSRLFSERFGFKNHTDIISRTYSRIEPKKNGNVVLINDWRFVSSLVKGAYGMDEFYHEAHLKKGPYVALRDTKGEITACAKFTKVHWQIKRLPGRYGSVLVRMIPYIPLLNKLINPKDHFFLVPDVVISKNNSVREIEMLFDSALQMNQVNSLIWFTDPNKKQYAQLKGRIKWGLLDKILGEKKVALVTRNQSTSYSIKRPVFVSSFDLI